MGNKQSQPPLSIQFIADFFNLLLAYKRILEKLSHNDVLSAIALVQMEEAFLLKQLTEWEVFSYNVLTYCVSLDTTQLAKNLNLTLPFKISFDNAQAILNGMNFTSFSNIKELNTLASKILVKKFNPFQQFLQPMTKHVDEAIIIRNYIAHKSNSSKTKLMKVYKTYGIKTFVEPGEFIQIVRDFKINTFSFSSLCYVIFMTMIVFTWRLLDKENYLLAFPTDKTPFDIGITKMYMMFNHLSEFKDPESPINF
jgi:hypothetical protein